MISWLFQKLFLGIIHLYRCTLSPLIGRGCRFEPTCSAYGLEAIREWGPWKGGWMTVKRIGKCQPMCAGGYDPVPIREKPPGSDGR